jgi:hypothetical protein
VVAGPRSKKKKKKNADSVNTTGMDEERILICVLHTQSMQRYTTSCLENKIRGASLFSGDEQVVERQKPAHHQEYYSDSCGDYCV